MQFFFFFNDTATTEIYTLSLHDALPISRVGSLLLRRARGRARRALRHGDQRGAVQHEHEPLRPRRQAQYGAHVRAAGARRTGGLQGRVRRAGRLLYGPGVGYAGRDLPRQRVLRGDRGRAAVGVWRGEPSTQRRTRDADPEALRQEGPGVVLGQAAQKPQDDGEARPRDGEGRPEARGQGEAEEAEVSPTALDGATVGKRTDVDRETFEVEGDLDRLAAAALPPELTRVAAAFRVDLAEIRLEPAAPPPRRSA